EPQRSALSQKRQPHATRRMRRLMNPGFLRASPPGTGATHIPPASPRGVTPDSDWRATDGVPPCPTASRSGRTTAPPPAPPPRAPHHTLATPERYPPLRRRLHPLAGWAHAHPPRAPPRRPPRRHPPRPGGRRKESLPATGPPHHPPPA